MAGKSGEDQGLTAWQLLGVSSLGIRRGQWRSALVGLSVASYNIHGASTAGSLGGVQIREVLQPILVKRMFEKLN